MSHSELKTIRKLIQEKSERLELLPELSDLISLEKKLEAKKDLQ